jgi:hypothetical protein
MVCAAPQHDTLDQGETWDSRCLATDDDDNPVDLTGMTITATMERRIDPNTTQDIVCTITDAAAGRFTLGLTPAETAALEVGVWLGQVKFVLGAVVEKSDYFAVTVRREIVT